MSLPPQLREEDYETIEAAVMETARGRWFLAEYARRNRAADTCTVLDAVGKLEKTLTGLAEAAGMPVPETNNKESADTRLLKASSFTSERPERNTIDDVFNLQQAEVERVILEEAQVMAPRRLPQPKTPSLIDAQNADLPKSSLPQIQAKLAIEYPAEEEEEAAPTSGSSGPAFSLSNYCFEEKVALFS
jgi:hypothetical protein